jgi:hypothetical protein
MGKGDKVWVGIYNHRHGDDVVVYDSLEAVSGWATQIVREWVHEIGDSAIEADIERLLKGDLIEEAVQLYCENSREERIDWSECTILDSESHLRNGV